MMLDNVNGIIEHKFKEVAPALLAQPGAWSNLYWRSGMFILTDKKRCSTCGEWKDKKEFFKNKSCKDGLSRQCKPCHTENVSRTIDKDRKREADRAWRLANPEKARQHSLRYYYKNAQQAYKRLVDWRKNNPEKRREQAEKWRLANPEKSKEADRRYLASHPEKALEKNRRRRALIKGNGGVITAQEWEALKEFYDYSCLCCRRQEPDIELTLDHVIPLKLGGINAISNAQPLCRACNASKGARRTTDYR